MNKPEEPVNQNIPPQQTTPESLLSPDPAAPQTAFAGAALQQPDYQPRQQPVEAFRWQATEYEMHPKSVGWMAGFGAVVAILFFMAYLTGMVTFMLLVVVLAVAAGVFSFRPPRMLNYAVTESGIEIEGKPYDLSQFRSFGVTHTESALTIVLSPAKRLGLVVRLRVGVQEADRVIDFLAHSLPMQDIQEDLIDKLFKKIRF